MPGALIYGANQLKEQNKLYVSGSYELSEGKNKNKNKKGLFPLEAALKILVYKNYMPVNLEKCWNVMNKIIKVVSTVNIVKSGAYTYNKNISDYLKHI